MEDTVASYDYTNLEDALIRLLRKLQFGDVQVTVKRGTIVAIKRTEVFKPEDVRGLT